VLIRSSTTLHEKSAINRADFTPARLCKAHRSLARWSCTGLWVSAAPDKLDAASPVYRRREWFIQCTDRENRSPHLPLSIPPIYAMIHANMWEPIRALWTTTGHAVIVWCLLAPPLVAAAYAIVAPVLRRVLPKRTARAAEAV
jgi:hypothetical protein